MTPVNELLYLVKINPKNRSALNELDNYLRNFVRKYLITEIYDNMVFMSAFSEIVLWITRQEEVSVESFHRQFTRIYQEIFHEYANIVAPVTVPPVVTLKSAKLNIYVLDKWEKVLLWDFINNYHHDLLKYPEDRKVVLRKILAKTNCPLVPLEKLSSRLSLPALYLVDKMGIENYLQFNKFMTYLDLYYPNQVPDKSLIEELRSRLLNKYIERYCSEVTPERLLDGFDN